MKYFWTLVVISIITKSSFTSANNFFHLCIANVDGSRTCGISTHRKAQLGIDLRRNSIHQTWTVVSNDVAMVPLYEHLLTRSATTISQVKRSIRRGFVFVNGKKATNDVIVGKGDVIQLVSQTSERSFSNLNRSGGATVEVLFEDDHCAVVNKPQGMTIFPTSCVAGQPAGWSLKSALLISLRPFNSTSCLGPCTEEGNQTLRSDINLIDARIPLRRPQPVHRIDKGTGGLVVVAKSRVALTALTENFAKREVSKRYFAVLQGTFNLPNNFPNLYIEEREIGGVQQRVGIFNHSLSGKEAVTEIRVLNHFLGPVALTLVEVSPLTGRTHQIRKHMQILGHAIVGDKRYGRQQEIEREESILEQSTVDEEDSVMYLWAVGVLLRHPVFNQYIEVELPVPAQIVRLKDVNISV